MTEQLAIPKAPEKRWYVIHTYSGYENKVKANLEHRIESMGMEDKIFQVLVPMEDEIEIRQGQRHTVQKKVYPGYVLVEMILDPESWFVVRNTPGVTSFVGSGNIPGMRSEPIPLDETEVKQILEDTAEIQCAAQNAVSLHTSDTIDMARLLKSTMRLRPDRIIVGEVRDGAALTLLKAWNTGHPGGVTTIHSNSTLSALRRLEQLTAEVSQQPMHAVIGEAVDLVVSIERAGKSRRVRDVMRVTGFNGSHYQTIHSAQIDEDSHAA